MADKKITDLVDGGDPQDTDDFVVARGVTNNKIAWSSMSNAIASGQIAIAASNTTYTSGTVVLTGLGGGVTVSSNVGQAVEISVAAPVAQSVQTQNVVDVTLSGNTAGALALISSGTMTIAGGNNITLSQAGNAITISGPNVAGAQTAISGLANSETTYTSGTVLLSELANITIRSTTGQAFQFSVPAQSVQPETQTFLSGLGNSQTTYTSGVVNLSVEAGLMTIRSTTGQAFRFSVSQSVQAETQTFLGGLANSETTYTSGSVTLSALANITIRSTTGQQFQFSVPGTTGTGNLNAISNSNTTYTSGTIGLSELGAITIRSTTGNQFQFSVNSQTVQTQNMVAVSATNTLYSSGTVLFTGSNMITVKSSGAGQTIILDATQSVQTQGGFLSAGVSTGGNTLGDTGVATGSRLVIVGTNGITASQGTAAGATTITLSGVTQSVQTQSFLSAGMSTGGNTSGDTGYVTGRLNFAGGNNITLSGSTNAGSMTITISAPNLGAGAMSAGVSNLGNTAGSTGITGTQLVLVGTGQVSLSQSTGANGGTVTISVPQKTAAAWENMPIQQAVLYTHLSGVSKTPFYWYENLPQGIKPANIAFRVSMVTAGSDLSVSAHFGIYTFVNSTSIALLGSGSGEFRVSSASSVSFSGQRQLVLTSPGTVAAISSLTPGAYVFGMMFSASATNAMNASIYAASGAAGPRLGRIMPGVNQLSTGTAQGIAGMYGRGSTTVNALPENVVAADLVNQGIGASSPMKPHIFIRS